jgi:hypothetical protein
MYRLDIGFTDLFNTQLVTTVNYTSIVNLHNLQSQPSLVVSWQRIYNSLTLTIHSKCHCTTAYMISSLRSLVLSFTNAVPILNHLFSISLSQETLSNNFSVGLGSSLYSHGADPTENKIFVAKAQQYFYCCLRIRCRGNVISESLPSNKRLLWLHYSGFQASCHNINRHVARMWEMKNDTKFIRNKENRRGRHLIDSYANGRITQVLRESLLE